MDTRDLYKLVRAMEDDCNENYIQLHDSFGIELGENFVIETGVVGFMEDGIIIHLDEDAIEFLDFNGVLVESEDLEEYMKLGGGGDAASSGTVDEAEYHGRKVPLGKKMQGDVKKSKVYVRKPNGKVVKVNFGDKTMRIKKSNPARRKSYRARHHCDKPGPRWKANYWSCRSW